MFVVPYVYKSLSLYCIDGYETESIKKIQSLDDEGAHSWLYQRWFLILVLKICGERIVNKG